MIPHVKKILFAFCLLSIVMVFGYSMKRGAQPTSDFMAYYGYSRLTLEGKQLEQYYTYDTFNNYIDSLGFPTMKVKPHNLPTNAFAMLPLARLSPQNAKIIWTLFSLALYFWSIIILFKIQGLTLKDNLGIGLLTLALLWRPLYENIAMGQFYIVLLFLFTISIYALIHKKTFFSSLPVAGTLLLKGYGIVALLWFVFKRKWSVLSITTLIVILTIVASLPLFSLSTWNAYYIEILSQLGRTAIDGHVAYQTINGFFLHMFTFDAHWLPFPVVQLSQGIVFGISLIANIALMSIVFAYTRVTTKNDVYLSYSAVIALGVVTAPISEEHSYILFLPLIIGLTVHLLKENNGKVQFTTPTLVMLISIALLAIPLRYEQLQYVHAPLIFFAYPKLYAGIALLMSYCFVVRKSDKQTA